MAWAQGKDFKGFGYRYVYSFQITDTVRVTDDTGADDTVADDMVADDMVADDTVADDMVADDMVADTATVGVPISSGRYRYQFAV